MRCIALAQAFDRLGLAEPVFVVRDLDGAALHEKLTAADGFELIFLPQAARGLDFDLPAYSPFVPGDIVVFDNYDVLTAQMRTVREQGALLVAVDDLADRRFCADMVINQNLGAKELVYDASPGTRFLLGPRYALLRRGMQTPEKRRTSPHPKVFACFGGGYFFPRIRGVLENLLALDASLGEPVGLDFALPDIPEQTEGVRSALAGCRMFAPNYIVGELDLSRHMAGADLAVTAGGSMVFELAHAGVPQLVLAIEANQEPTARRVDAAGLGICLGKAKELDSAFFTRTFMALLGNPGKRREMSMAGKALVDGRGAERSAEAIAALPRPQA
jgi:spore coat polysaccharide biosynthesis predicted glycosyltransferase SpsG